MRKLFFYILAFSTLASCDRDKIGPQSLVPPLEPALKGRQVLILNEGNFQRGNASVSAYNPQKKEVQNAVFSNFNQGLPLGDVAQDLMRHNGRYYISLNGSGAVRVIDSLTWQAVGDITINGTPTYLAMAADKLWVSDLFKKKIWQLNLNTLSVSKAISTPMPASRLINWQNKLVAVAGKNLLVIDLLQDKVEYRKSLPGAGGDMVIDAQDRLWILTRGKASERSLSQLSSPEDSITSYTLGAPFPNESPKHLSMDGSGKKLFICYQNKVFAQPINQPVPNGAESRFNFSMQTLYGFNVDAVTGDFYLSDALDFDQAAEVSRYDSTGTLIHNFKVGRIANGFYF